jgi:hypothetical protein
MRLTLHEVVVCFADMISENETELSFFNRQAYETFKANPEVSLSSVRSSPHRPQYRLKPVSAVAEFYDLGSGGTDR